MALQIASNFLLEAQLPNFARDMFEDVASMAAYPETSLPEIFISTVKGDGVYVYKAENDVDPTTGKWRKLKGTDTIQADFEKLKTQVENWKGSMSDSELEKGIDTLISEAIAAVVAEAPEAFDTLKEIADWIGDDTLGTIKDLANIKKDLANVIKLVGELPSEQKKNEDGDLLYTKKDGSETTASTEVVLENGYRVTKIDGGADCGFYLTEDAAIERAKLLTAADGNEVEDYLTYYNISADSNNTTIATTPIMVKTCKANTIVEYVDEKVAELASSDDIAYTDEEGAVKEIGGWKVGDTANKMSFQDFAYKLLHPYIAPEVTLSINPAKLQDKSKSGVANVILTANVTKHTNSITSVDFYAGTDKIEGIITNVENGGTFTSTYTPSTAINEDITFKVVVNDGEKTSNATKILSFAYPAYSGAVAADVTVDASNIATLISDETLKDIELRTTKGYDQSFSGRNVRAVYVYDTSKGRLSRIEDSTLHFEYTNDFSESVVPYNGVNYYVYQQKVAATITDSKFTFSYS